MLEDIRLERRSTMRRNLRAQRTAKTIKRAFDNFTVTNWISRFEQAKKGLNNA